MNTSETKRVVRVAASAFISAALALGTVGIASADGSHHNLSHHSKSSEGHHYGLTGTVTAIGTGTFTVQGREGAPVVYTTSATTAYYLGKTVSSASTLAVGERVFVQLTNTTPQTVATVVIELASFEGNVTAIAGNVITLTGHEGSTSRTVNVTSTTSYTQGGVASTLAAVVVGSEIKASGLFDTTGALNAISVKISAPELFAAGTVTAIGTGTFTVQPRNGAPVVYTTTATTAYYLGKTLSTVTSLAVGERVMLLLTTTTPQTVATVVIAVPSFEGKVTAVAGNVITITGHEGLTSRTVNVTATTTYLQGGTASTLAAVVVGSEIKATGLIDTTGALNAISIKISGGHSHHSQH